MLGFTTFQRQVLQRGEPPQRTASPTYEILCFVLTSSIGSVMVSPNAKVLDTVIAFVGDVTQLLS
jgi:hypothetical protein